VLLTAIKNSDDTPILPLLSDDPDAFMKSPLAATEVFGDGPSEMASSLMGPGPWVFSTELKLPSSCTTIRFSNKNKRSNITISHSLKIIMRVERGDDSCVDAKTGKKKLFDIVVQAPINILSVSLTSPFLSHISDEYVVPLQPRVDEPAIVHRIL
jgi:hypothetical protein